MEENSELILPLVNEENICLPLPINVVAKYWNINLPIKEAAKTAQRYQEFEGSILIEGIELAERHGLECIIAHSSIEELKRIITELSIPPIVILPGIPEITHHASVITGYDQESILHYIQTDTAQGEQQEGAIPQKIFEQEWSEDGNVMILIAPSDILSKADLNHISEKESNRLCLMAERLSILGDYDNALQTLKKAIEHAPNNTMALQMLGSMMNAQNDPQCINIYNRCLKNNDRAYLAHNGIGNYYLKAKQFEKAQSHYTKAIKINPKRSARIYKNRAYLTQSQGDYTKSCEDLKMYLKYNPRAQDRGIVENLIREMNAERKMQ